MTVKKLRMVASMFACMVLGTACSTLLAGCDKKDKDEGKAAESKVFEVKDVGVKISAPGDWSLKQRGDEWLLGSGMKGVVLRRKDGSMPETPEEVAKRFAESKILASEKLPSGAIYIFYEMDFPSESGSMKLKFVHSIVALAGGGTATCRVQLQSDDEQALYEPICKSMEPL